MNKSFYTNAVWAAILVLVIFIVPMSVEACPGCKELDEPIAKGFNWSILFLMAMPFTVFGLIGGTIFLNWNGYRLSVIGSRLKDRFIKRKPFNR